MITERIPVTAKIIHGYPLPISITAKMQKNEASAAIERSSTSIRPPIISKTTPIAASVALSVSFLVFSDTPRLI